jgi:acetyl-CoA C-acetyltransferase
MRNVVIVSAVRLPGGKYGGSMKNLTAPDMGGHVIAEAVKRANISPEDVGQVIFGNGWQAGVGPNPARIATIKGGLPVSCPAFTINIRCASGLRAVQLGVLSIGAGEEDIVLAGGMESATNVPYYAEDTRWGARMGDKKLVDGLTKDGFMCPMAGMLMGSTAEMLAEKYKISRREQDSYALSSHQKAIAAVSSGAFEQEILPVEVKDHKSTRIFAQDEIPRDDTSIEKMEKLPPVFSKGGTVTAGNSSALCDGASAVVLMAEDVAAQRGIKPLARVLSYSYVALDPLYMGLGPVFAIPKALKQAGLKQEDIDLFEINEAFAAQVLACDRELHFDMEKVNVFGGAIALGHPVGATGAKILTTLLYALRGRQKRYGLVSLCIGGGQGAAMIVENID